MKTEKRIRNLCNKELSHLIHEICVAENLFSGFTLCGGSKLKYKTGVLFFTLQKETARIKSVLHLPSLETWNRFE